MHSRVFILAIIFTTLLTGCANEIHRDGKVLYYSHNGEDLYIIYQHNNENHLLNAKLDPMIEKWDKVISGHPGTPSIVVSKDYLACNCKKDKVCIISRESGEKILDFESSLVFSMNSKGYLLDGQTVYSICGQNDICAYDIEKNEKLWSFKLGDDVSISHDLQINENTLVFGAENTVYALSTTDGTKLWKTDEGEELSSIHLFSETVVVDRGNIDGLDVRTGESKWTKQYSGKTRCVMDGNIVIQENDFFKIVFIENGSENWEYPRNGTTFLTCQEELSLVAFTVKNYSEQMAEADVSEYYDKVYIFDSGSGERVFDFNSDSGYTVLNLTGFDTENYDIAFEDIDKPDKILVDRYAVENFSKKTSFEFKVYNPGQQIYVSNIFSDSFYSIFKRTNINDQTDENNYLFDSDTGKLIGEMKGYPEVISHEKCYDIVSYDEYFNIIEKDLEDFVD